MADRNQIEHFWTPRPEDGRIVGVINYRDMIVVATEYGGVYVIRDRDTPRPIETHEIERITDRAFRS